VPRRYTEVKTGIALRSLTKNSATLQVRRAGRRYSLPLRKEFVASSPVDAQRLGDFHPPLARRRALRDFSRAVMASDRPQAQAIDVARHVGAEAALTETEAQLNR
jgi:hypothetical protein